MGFEQPNIYMKKNSWEATIIAVEKPVMLWWYLKKPIEHLLNRLYCTFSCNITFKPFAFDVLFTTNNCSSRLVNDSKYLSCRALIRAAGVRQFRFDCTRPHLIVIAFFIENTTMDAVSRCISCGFPNRRKQLLETTRASFSSVKCLQYQHGRIEGRKKHNSTENPEISVLLAYNMQLFTEKWKRRKSCSQKAGEKPRNQKKSNKNRIGNIKIIASKKRKKTQNRKIYDFFSPDPVIITVSPKS